MLLSPRLGSSPWFSGNNLKNAPFSTCQFSSCSLAAIICTRIKMPPPEFLNTQFLLHGEYVEKIVAHDLCLTINQRLSQIIAFYICRFYNLELLFELHRRKIYICVPQKFLADLGKINTKIK